jgi:hypothetical protein
LSEIEAAGYARRRLLAALLGRSHPPPGIVRPLGCGAVLSAILAGTELLRQLG